MKEEFGIYCDLTFAGIHQFEDGTEIRYAEPVEACAIVEAENFDEALNGFDKNTEIKELIYLPRHPELRGPQDGQDAELADRFRSEVESIPLQNLEDMNRIEFTVSKKNEELR